MNISRPLCSLNPVQAKSSVMVERNTNVRKTKAGAVLNDQLFRTGKYCFWLSLPLSLSLSLSLFLSSYITVLL